MKEVLDSIYLLSDGDPTGGICNTKDMEEFIQKQNKVRTDRKKPGLKIHVVCFMLGGDEVKSQRKKAIEFLKHIASISKGTYRAVDDKISKNKDIVKAPKND